MVRLRNFIKNNVTIGSFGLSHGWRENAKTRACILGTLRGSVLLIHTTGGEALRRLAQLCERGVASYQDLSYCALQFKSAYLLRTVQGAGSFSRCLLSNYAACRSIIRGALILE